MDGLKISDSVLRLSLMKFLNLMIDRADNETKQAKFVAKLESVGIFEHLYEAVLSGEDDLIM